MELGEQPELKEKNKRDITCWMVSWVSWDWSQLTHTKKTNKHFYQYVEQLLSDSPKTYFSNTYQVVIVPKPNLSISTALWWRKIENWTKRKAKQRKRKVLTYILTHFANMYSGNCVAQTLFKPTIVVKVFPKNTMNQATFLVNVY